MPPQNIDYIELAHQRAAEKKTHVSFPQLKYPSLRDEGMKDSLQWLKGKAMDDGAEGLWRVHNGIYDLTDFVQSHPGGAEWLKLTKGTDITEAFECHHISNIAEKMLKNFYVREAKTPRNSPFTFEDDGFYRSLKRAVREELKKIPKSVTRSADMIIDGLLATCLLTSALSCYLKNYWGVMACYLIASLSLAWVVVASHNYIHRRSNWRMHLFSMSLWSYSDFRISHALSHHLYPNTLMDLEVSAFEPIVFWNPRKVGIMAQLSLLIEHIFFPFLFIVNFSKRLACNFKYSDFFTNNLKWQDFVGLFLPVFMWLVSGVTFYEAFVNWLWIVCTASYIFANIGSNAAHHHPLIFKDGDEIEETTRDWGIHEVDAVMDRTDINDNFFKVMTFFGDHTLHHLFPTLDHALLSYLYPVFLEHCEKYKANFRRATQFEMFIGQIQMVLKQNPTPLKGKKTE